jgi:hypothetical protein
LSDPLKGCIGDAEALRFSFLGKEIAVFNSELPYQIFSKDQMSDIVSRILVFAQLLLFPALLGRIHSGDPFTHPSVSLINLEK